MFFDKRVRISMSRTAINLKLKMSRLLEKRQKNKQTNKKPRRRRQRLRKIE